MDRLCSIIVVLLLTRPLISSTSQEEFKVYSEPKHIQVCEGDSVTFNCFFQPGGKHKVSWYYSQTPNLGCDSLTDKIPEEQHFYTQKNDICATLNINSIKTNESGWYFCKVTKDIPFLENKCSDGIQVLVDTNSTQEYPKQTQTLTQNLTTQDSPTTCLISATTIPTTSSTPPYSIAQWRIWLALAVGCVVLVVLIVVICILTRKPKEIIYENTKPVESSCWRQNRTKMEICDLPKSQKTDTIKPLRKYDTLSSNRIHRP
ncbi:uncharacterized protein [Sinocyclocheilus grahami]|uniref:uncharacterized protein isoform X1 n=1 Tax=Sinocyclocheilus grahami TaxID=75366 RepID=UPI0007ACEFE0|nr:PREDICTED: uncharacterized protein LOC107560684 isoform X1 [Sinocyclocheilus grahami]XP_016100413.1 PREDICTED: uncharacterized protein LOC107560684 isoform X1 [Sinocyclocheilus grahami]